MPITEPIADDEPVSLIEYAGCLHAFVGAFLYEVASLKSLAKTLQGSSRAEAFGWAAALDRTRYRVPLLVERWRYFNETVRGRLIIQPEERERYQEVPSLQQALETCMTLEEMLERTNRFIDGIEEYTPDDVRLMGEMVEALTQAIEPERECASRIAALMDRCAQDRLAVSPDSASGLLMIGGSNEGPDYPQQFAEAREQFVRRLG